MAKKKKDGHNVVLCDDKDIDRLAEEMTYTYDKKTRRAFITHVMHVTCNMFIDALAREANTVLEDEKKLKPKRRKKK